jgi:hypothetical protein
MFDKIENLREKLNNMLESDDLILHSGEILKVSQELDKHIVEAQIIKIEEDLSLEQT